MLAGCSGVVWERGGGLEGADLLQGILNATPDCSSLMELVEKKNKNQLQLTSLLMTQRQGCFLWKDRHAMRSSINTSSIINT